MNHDVKHGPMRQMCLMITLPVSRLPGQAPTMLNCNFNWGSVASVKLKHNSVDISCRKSRHSLFKPVLGMSCCDRTSLTLIEYAVGPHMRHRKEKIK